LEELEAERADVRRRQAELQAREAALERLWERKYAERLAAVDAQAAKLAQEFEQRAKETIKELSQKAQARIARIKREFREQVEAIAPAVVPAAHGAARPRLGEGVRVRLKGVRQPATVRRVFADGRIEVEAGFVKLQVPESDVEEVLATQEAPKPAGIQMRQGPRFEGSFREINLIGQRAEEACEALDKFLDTVALAQVDRVRIVHGHGMGILKRAVADLLKNNPHVAKYYVAPPEEGGSGSTIVELK
jgi:DNA mismatch repair protein MutS2